MRIFYASDTTPNASFQSNLWRNNLYLSLVDLGHEVIEFNYDLREVFKNLDPSDPRQRQFIKKNRPLISEELLKQIRKANAENTVDLFFSYFYDACVLPEIIEEIKAMGIKTVNWYCNGSYQLNLVSEISPHYDWCLVPEKFRLDDYKKLGARPIYCQEAANPVIYKPYDLSAEYDVTFIGQAYGERPYFIKYLLDNDVDVRVWGYGWGNYVQGFTLKGESLVSKISSYSKKIFRISSYKKLYNKAINFVQREDTEGEQNENRHITLTPKIIGGTLSDIEMIKMYSRSKINLGFSACGDTHKTSNPIRQIRLRDFEVPMSGGFYMVQYMNELEEFFNTGKEIVCYENEEDLVAKIKFYLAHDSEREKIRIAGYERCIKDHTWQKRFETCFKQMELM